jgi:hypothetical protein
MNFRQPLARVRAQLEARQAPVGGVYADAVELWHAVYGHPPDQWQREILLSQSPRVLMCCARQVGKSATSAVLGLFVALEQAPAMVLLVSASLRQSQELGRKLFNAYCALGRPVAAEAESLLSLSLASGSRIVCLPSRSATLRGFSSPALVVCDEAAYIPDEIFYSLTPMLAASPGGRLIALSSPAGRVGWFYECWQNAHGWERTRITAAECPRICPEFLEEQRAMMPPALYAQEFEAEFLEVGGHMVFRPELVRASVVPGIPPFTFSWEQRR